MRKLAVFCLITLVVVYAFTDSKFLRKELKQGDVTVKWFYYSYISNNSPDFITVEKNGETKEIYKAWDVVTNVKIMEGRIILKLFEPDRGIVNTKRVEDSVYGFKIVLDTTATLDDHRSIPDGIKQGFW